MAGVARPRLQLDDALLEQQRQAYAVQGVDESEPAVLPKKRKQAHINGEEVSILSRYSGLDIASKLTVCRK